MGATHRLVQFLRGRFARIYEKYKRDYTEIVTQNPDYEKASAEAAKAGGLSLVPGLGPAILAFEDALKEERQHREIRSIKDTLARLTEEEVRETAESTGVDPALLEEIKRLHTATSEVDRNKILRSLRTFKSESRRGHREIEEKIDGVRHLLERQSEIVKSFLDVIREKRKLKIQSTKEISINLSSHLKEVLSWSERIQFYGMSSAEHTDKSTIGLDMATVPRKFAGTYNETEKIDEKHLLQSKENYLLLGSPGSGKTTTLKRLARLILWKEPLSEQDTWQYPIVVRLRRLSADSPLFVTLAETVGLNYETKKIERVREVIEEHKEWNDFRQEDVIKKRKKIEPYTITETYIGDEPLRNMIPEILNETNAILLLDGLDEISSDLKDDLENDIESLALKMPDSRIIVSCRSGEYGRHLEGFDVLEVCPLNEEQILAISSKWLDHPESFLRELKELPYYDLSSRPLFLTHLIVLYRNKGYLPEQPSSVYKQIIELLLEKWDRERGVKRISKYAYFGVEKKLEFLSTLSYYLTYKYRLKYFKTKDLVEIYDDVYFSFNLPEKESEEVAREIETHTGIIAESTDESYEFSHLSLQEYLCAYYLVREPAADHLIDYLVEYPSPIAVAVSLSSDPSNWFAWIILNDKKYHTIGRKNIRSLMSRIIQERPYFKVSKLLGLAIIRLIIDFENDLSTSMEHLFRTESVRRSFSLALSYYQLNFEKSDSECYWLDQFALYEGEYPFYKPKSGPIPIRYVDRLLRSSHIVLRKVKAGSSEYGVFKKKF